MKRPKVPPLDECVRLQKENALLRSIATLMGEMTIQLYEAMGQKEWEQLFEKARAKGTAK